MCFVCSEFLVVFCYFVVIQDPLVTGFQPGVGPVSGGSRLTVIGRHLNVGSHVTIVLTNGNNATVSCRLHGKRFSDSMLCVTGVSAKPAVMNSLVVSVDSARVDFTGHFSVIPDPIIETVMPFKTIIRSAIKLNCTFIFVNTYSYRCMYMCADGIIITKYK